DRVCHFLGVGRPRRRPDVRGVERQVATQSAQIGVAEADLYPTIFLNGTLGYEAQDLSKLFESQSFLGTITPNFKWNIPHEKPGKNVGTGAHPEHVRPGTGW